MDSSTQTVAIIANGTITDFEAIAELIKSYDVVIAADGGANHCHAMKIKPDLIVGDLDSITPKVKKSFTKIKTLKYASEKDETDLELSIHAALTYNPSQMTLFAASGDRLDHTLTNLYLLQRYPLKLFMETEREVLFVISKSTYIDCHEGQTLSLLPLGLPAKGVTTKGLKWELKNATLDNNCLSVSNVSLFEQVHISIKKGALLCCLNKAFPT